MKHSEKYLHEPRRQLRAENSFPKLFESFLCPPLRFLKIHRATRFPVIDTALNSIVDDLSLGQLEDRAFDNYVLLSAFRVDDFDLVAAIDGINEFFVELESHADSIPQDSS